MMTGPESPKKGKKSLLPPAIPETPPLKAYEDLAFLAAYLCDAPISLITLDNGEQPLMLASYGIEASHKKFPPVLDQNQFEPDKEFVQVADAGKDPRFFKNPWVASDPFLKFMASVPLRSAEGGFLGTLSVMDQFPRTLEGEQLEALIRLAGQAVYLLLSRQSGQLPVAREVCEFRPDRTSGDLSGSPYEPFLEMHFKAIIDHLPGVVVQFTFAADGSIALHSVSEVARDLWGIAPKVLQEENQLFWDRCHPEDRTNCIDSLHKAAHSHSLWHHEWRYNHPDGKQYWHKGWGKPRKLAEEVVIDAIVMDITSDRRFIEDLRQRNGHIDTIMAHIPIGIAVNQISNGKATFLNRMFARIYGWDDEDFTDVDSFFKKVYPEEAYRDAMQARITTDIASGDPDRMQWNHVKVTTKNRGIRYINARNIPLPSRDIMISTVIDVTEERLARDAIKRTKAELDKIMQASLDIICTVDEEGYFRNVSNASRRIWGYDPEEMAGKHFTSLVYRDDLDRTRRAHLTIMQGTPMTDFENRYLRKDGAIIPMLWSANWDERDRIMYCVARDATERIKALTALQRSEKRFKSLAQEGIDVNGIFDRKGMPLYVSPTSTRLLGVPPGMFIGKNPVAFIHPKDRFRVYRAFLKVPFAKKVTLAPFRVKHQDGTYRWVETVLTDFLEEPAVAGIVANTRDITERIKWENSLRTSEEKYRLFFDESPLPKIIYDLDTLTCLEVNRAASTHYGYSRQEFMGMDIHKIRSREEVASLKAEFEDPFKKDQVKHFGIFTHTRKNGTQMHMEVYGQRLGFQGKDCLIAMGIDVTEKELYVRDLKASEQKLKEATKIAKLGYWSLDMDGHTLNWSDEVYNIWGRDRETFTLNFDSFLETIHPADREQFLAEQKEAFAGNRKHDYVHRILLPDGQIRWVHEKGILEKDKMGNWKVFQGSVQDITKQREEQHRLELLESVVTNTSDAVLIIKAEPTEKPEPRIVYINEAFTRMTGYATAEVLGRDPGILQGPKSDKSALKRLRAALKLWEPYETTLLNYKKNGDEFWNHISITPVANEGGGFTHWVAIERDVTEAKNQEFQKKLFADISYLFNQDEKLKTCLEHVLERIVDFGDFSLGEIWLPNSEGSQINRIAKYSGSASGRTFYKLSKSITHFQPGEGFPGAIWLNERSEMWEQLDKAVDFVRSEAARKAGISSGLGMPLLHNKAVVGVLLLYSTYPTQNPAYYGDMFRQLESFMGAEIKRKRLEEELNKLFRFVPDIIAMAGTDGYFKKINPATVKLLEYSEEELFSRPILEFIHPEDRQGTRKQQQKIYKRENTGYFENRYITKSGKTIWLNWTATRSPEEDIIYAVAKDISEKKAFEESRRKLTVALQEHAKKLEVSNAELEQFAYVASHDLQEPLRMVTNFLSQLEKKYGSLLDEKGKQYIFYAVDGAKRMRQIILDLLEYSRAGKEESEPEWIDLNQIIEEYGMLRKQRIRELKATITKENLPVIKSYKAPLTQIIHNLLDNALKYSKEGRPPRIDVSVRENGPLWELAFRDNGIGIEREYFEKIFEIFQRLHGKSQYDGSGMGLAIVKKLVENLGGQIWLTSVPDEGSTFYLTLSRVPS